MTETPQAAAPHSQRRVRLMIAAGLLFVGLYLLVFLVPDFMTSAPGPTTMTMAQAAEAATDSATYASIEDGRWDCDTIEYIRGRSSTNSQQIETRFTNVFREDAAGEIVLLASLSGEFTCADLDGWQLTGYLTRMSDVRQQELTNEARLARYFDATTFLEFCGYCGAGNSLIGVIFGVVITLAGVALLVTGLRIPAQVAAQAKE